MRKKNYKLGKGKYYFNIRNGQHAITIMRATKEEAQRAFLNYVDLKKECEWLGCWNGKKFEENTTPVRQEAN